MSTEELERLYEEAGGGLAGAIAVILAARDSEE